MALNKDFRVKDSLYVGTSGYFAGSTSINTAGRILSAGVDLATLFQPNNLATLSNGDGINTFTYNGDTAASVAVDATVVRTSGAQTIGGVKTFSDTPIFSSGITVNGNIGVTGTVDGRDISNDGLKLDSTYTTVNTNSANWNSGYTQGTSTYTTVNANSGSWSSVYTTTNANSGSWSSVYTTTNANSGRWSNVYSAYNAASGALVNTGSSPSQGTVRLTQQNGSNIDIDTGLQAGDSPTFAGATAGNVRVGITTDNEIDTSTGDLIIDSAGGLTTITDNLSVTGSVTTSGLGTGGNTDSVVVKNADSTLQTRTADTRIWGTTLLDGSSLTTGRLTKVSDANTLVNSIASESGTTIFVAGGLSAVSLSGNGAGLTGVTATPIFPTTEITDIIHSDKIFVNDGTNKFITYCNLILDIAESTAGTGLEVNILNNCDNIQLKNVDNFTDGYTLKWDDTNGQLTNSIISDNGATATVNGAFCTTGSTTLGDNTADSTVINGSTINVPNIAAGTDNSVVVYNGTSLVTDEIDPKVWAIKLVDYGTLTQNYIPVATNSTGTVGNSIIQQTGGGTGITVCGDTTVTGNLSVTGNFTYIDTTVTVTSALTINNAGTGPGLQVTQSGVQPIAQFTDAEGGTIIFSDTGRVGIGTTAPGEKLTVSGNISSNGNIIISGTVDGRDVSNDGLKLDSTFTTVNTNSANWSTAYTQGGSTYTTVNANSANWNTAYTQGGSTYTTVNANSGRWSSVYTTTNANSGSWSSAYTTTNANSANWNIGYAQGTSAFSTVNANSGIWSNAYTSYNATSGALVNTGSSPSQGTVRLTQQSGSNIDIDTGLQSGDSPTFAGTTISANGRITQYATGGTIYREEGVFTGTVGATPTTVATFSKTNLETARYTVTLAVGANRTAFEILLTYNGTDAFGTVYAIVDAQATSQLTAVDVSVAGTTVDLVITAANAGTTATIHGIAHY